jgi:hypothetical protein
VLLLVTGEAGGFQNHHALDLAQAAGDEPPLVFCWEEPALWSGTAASPGPPLAALAALAGRLADPAAPAEALRVPDPGALRPGRPYLRAARRDDHTPETLRLATLAVRGQFPEALVLAGLSRCYDQALLEAYGALAGLESVAGGSPATPAQADRRWTAAQAAAGEAIARILFDLARSGRTVIATAHEVEATRKGAVVGTTPHLPKAGLNQASTWLRALDEDRCEVRRSSWAEFPPGTILLPHKDAAALIRSASARS